MAHRTTSHQTQYDPTTSARAETIGAAGGAGVRLSTPAAPLHGPAVRLRRLGGKHDGSYTLGLSIPHSFLPALAHLERRMFSCSLTDDGILFTLIPDPSDSDSLPAWLNGEEA